MEIFWQGEKNPAVGMGKWPEKFRHDRKKEGGGYRHNYASYANFNNCLIADLP
jgi:hypothetical protein